jgi:hypothetical protein
LAGALSQEKDDRVKEQLVRLAEPWRLVRRIDRLARALRDRVRVEAVEVAGEQLGRSRLELQEGSQQEQSPDDTMLHIDRKLSACLLDQRSSIPTNPAYFQMDCTDVRS